MTPPVPLANLTFSLDPSSLAGFLGADAALATMLLPHVHHQRKWWGWYNCPGSYHLAKRYGQLARFAVWSPKYSASAVPPELALELGPTAGPPFTSARSGATLQHTGALSKALLEECRMVEGVVIDGRLSDSVDVAIVQLKRAPKPTEYPRVPHMRTRALGLLPIVVSLSTGIACVYYREGYIAVVIFLSALFHGTACWVMGNAKFTYEHRIPPQTPTLDSGWLEAPNTLVVLRGSEGEVAPITRGRFTLLFDNSMECVKVTLCSVLLGLQFLLQLLLVPQGKLLGQALFIGSLIPAWLYHRFLLSDSEAVQRRILMDEVLGGPVMKKYRFPNRTAAAVFAVLALRPLAGSEIGARLRALLPRDTPVWELWHKTVAERLVSGRPLRFAECVRESRRMRILQREEDYQLFETLLQDADNAYGASERYSPVAGV